MDFLPPPDLILHSNEDRLLRGAFLLCLEDLRTCMEYVEPHDQNLGTFSHRTYELLLRISTEFETACKHAARSRSITLGARPNIRDYQGLAEAVGGTDAQVHLLFWNPQPRIVAPFSDWVAGKSLGWYADYGLAKHDRYSHFKEARFENVLLAFAALFILLNVGPERPVFSWNHGSWDHETGRHQQYFAEYELILEATDHEFPVKRRPTPADQP